MKIALCRLLAAACLAWAALAAPAALRAQDADLAADAAVEAADSYSYRPVRERAAPVKPAVAKAQARAAERTARLESLRWYGMIPGRPTATPLAWTTMYSHGWQMPEGRPFAWHTANRPIIVYPALPGVVYR
ncbi:MAG TPA: hypothetical protein PJ982_12305 [Lacipirellulaceae bacterium]|nr:hypothetical protein [Lacipirellulaceae bacterium]